MRIIYEAYDGKQFDTAEGCKYYESKSSILLDQKNFLCFDKNLYPIKLCEGDKFVEVIEKAYFFICFTEEAVTAFQEEVYELDESDTFPYIHKDILYGWAVDNNDCWSDVREVTKELEMSASYLRRAILSMNEDIERAKQGK